MECPLVEPGAESGLGLAAMAADLELAELVCERLPGPGDVAFHLGRDLVLGERCVVAEVGHGLLARPTELMDACVYDEPAGAPHLIGQPSEILIRRLVDTHDGAKPLGIETPTLGVPRERRAPSERRALRPFKG